MTPPPPPLSPLSSPPLSYQEVRRACSPAPSRRAGNSRASGSSGLDDPRSAMPTYPPFPSLLAAPRLPSLVRQSDGPATARRPHRDEPATAGLAPSAMTRIRQCAPLPPPRSPLSSPPLSQARQAIRRACDDSPAPSRRAGNGRASLPVAGNTHFVPLPLLQTRTLRPTAGCSPA